MPQKQTGWIVAFAALGMMCTLLAGDVKNLQAWSDALDPAFVAGFMTHLGVVIAAFIGGNLVPNMFKGTDAVSDQTRSKLSDKAGV